MHQQQIKQREQDVALGEVPLHERLAQAAKAQGLPPPDGRHFLSPVQQAALRRPNARRPKGLQVFGERDQSAPRTRKGVDVAVPWDEASLGSRASAGGRSVPNSRPGTHQYRSGGR